MSENKGYLDKSDKDVAVVEREGLFGQMTVQPLEIRGNDADHPLGFVREWAKFFSLPTGRMESVFNLGIWGFTGGTVACFVSTSAWLAIPAIMVIALMGVISFYTPELSLVILLRTIIILVFIVATMFVL
jgi:hypothetical protein